MKLCKLFFHLGDLMGYSINIGLPFNHNFVSLTFGDRCVDTAGYLARNKNFPPHFKIG